MVKKDTVIGIIGNTHGVRRASNPIPAANSIKDNNGNLLFDPYVITTKEGISIAYIGLASPFLHSEVAISDPYESLLNVIDEVKSISELIILLLVINILRYINFFANRLR